MTDDALTAIERLMRSRVISLEAMQDAARLAVLGQAFRPPRTLIVAPRHAESLRKALGLLPASMPAGDVGRHLRDLLRNP